MRLRSTRLASISSSASRIFSPSALFAATETGVWYDPSDLTTLFQDTAGITPVTAAGQTVALMLDKSRVSAPESRRNLLFLSQSIQTSPWIGNFVSGASSTELSPDGVTFAAAITGPGDTGTRWSQSYASAPIATYTFSVWLRAATNFDTEMLLMGQSSIISVTTSWQRFSITRTTSSIATLVAGFRPSRTAGVTRTVFAWGGQLEVGATATTYQPTGTIYPTAWLGTHATQATGAARPTYRLDAGSLPYLEFDGVDDSMTAASIPFSTTDKVSVFAGARKITSGMIAQFGQLFNSEPGSFVINSTTTGYAFPIFGGTGTVNTTINGLASPETAVLTQLVDFSLTTNATRARRNGLQIGTSGATSPGATTVGTKTLSLGYRSNSTNYLNGRIYGLIVRGAATNDEQIARTEAWLNQRTGAY